MIVRADKPNEPDNSQLLLLAKTASLFLTKYIDHVSVISDKPTIENTDNMKNQIIY